MNPAESVVSCRGHSTVHFRGGDWESGTRAARATGRRRVGDYVQRSGGRQLPGLPEKMRIAEEVIGGMLFPVRLLNVTKLTNFRKNSHQSIWVRKGAGGEEEGVKEEAGLQPLVPPRRAGRVELNELIYASLVLDLKSRSWKHIREQGRFT
ncbi:hypothetical protein GUJ93_ZPchr0006g43160 [Zizania palustris]|uniref:Trichome birefringence-like C-terminal domain-containing protein n=1 Tax=Zizania palustris TaxID=103762 RepID=A0A8J5T0Y7_ZIZPA|nr:hypothetical protein GUJ93_ZPchr0006g43160 [Zizania palustris]